MRVLMEGGSDRGGRGVLVVGGRLMRIGGCVGWLVGWLKTDKYSMWFGT